MRKGKRPFYKYWVGLSSEQRHELAEKLGTTPEYLYQVATDFRVGSPRFLKGLEEKTGVPRDKMLDAAI